MSIPHSKVLSVSKGFGLGAEFHNNSPASTQVVNVNINKNSNNELKDPQLVSYPPSESNPYSSLSNDNSEHQNDVKNESQNESNTALLQYKDNVIEALSTLLNIVENNPLVVNKLIVASVEDLSNLIKLLTGSDSVQINTSNDIECSCINKDFNFVAVDKIYVQKGNETQNFKYSYPEANKILDDHHVSVKLVRI